MFVHQKKEKSYLVELQKTEVGQVGEVREINYFRSKYGRTG